MANYKQILSFSILFSVLISCGKTEKKEEDSTQETTELINEQKSIKNDTVLQQKNTDFHTPKDSINQVTGSVLGNQHYKRKKGTIVVTDSTEVKTGTNTETNTGTNIGTNTGTNNNTTTPTQTVPKKPTKPSFVYIKKILRECEIGVTMTQEDLEKKFNIPKEAMKLVKSVTKTAPDEIDIKWKSTWLVEKVSDAKFKDGKLKMRFDNNKMYTSGGAISIKFEKKLYSDLMLIGRSAHIPSVKGYYWQIGKDK